MSRMRHCDQCGQQAPLRGRHGWLTLAAEGKGETESDPLKFIFSDSEDKSDLCSWDCVRDYAVLQLHEAEVSK